MHSYTLTSCRLTMSAYNFLFSSFFDKIDCIGKVHNYGREKKRKDYFLFEWMCGNDMEHNADLNNE